MPPAAAQAVVIPGTPRSGDTFAENSGAVTVLPVTGDGPNPPEGYVLFSGAVFGTTSAGEVPGEGPALRVVPNPAAGAVRFGVVLSETAHVRLVVPDVLGREVGVVLDGARGAGAVGAEPLSGLAPGVYVARLVVAGQPDSVQSSTVVR